jgi:hypothetical protein
MGPAIFVIDLQDASKNNFSFVSFSVYICMKAHLHNFSKKKIKMRSQNRKNQGFLTNFA